MARRTKRNSSALAQDVERIKQHFPGSKEIKGDELAKLLRLDSHKDYEYQPDQLNLFDE